MCDAGLGVAAASFAVSAYTKYQTEKVQGEVDQAVAEYNARAQENAATLTRERGVKEENAKRLEIAKQAERQKSQLAANGLDIGSGTSLKIVDDTFLRGESDALTIRQNYKDQTDAMDEQSRLTLLQGKNARKLARMRGVYGGVSSGLQSASAGYSLGLGIEKAMT